MIRGIDNIISFIHLNKCTYYQIRVAADKEAFLFQSDDENETAAEREKRFTETLELLQPGKYYLEGWINAGQKRNWYRTYIYIDENRYPDPALGQLPANNISIDDIDRRINEAVERERMRIELESLKAEKKENDAYIRELEKNSGNAFDRIIGKLEPYAPAIIAALTKQPLPAVAGIPGQNNEILNDTDMQEDEERDRIERICERLCAHRPDYLDLLEKVCDQLDAKPALAKLIDNYLV